MPRRVHLDFETASRIDLRKTGVRVYAEDRSTMILCASWAFDAGPVTSWRIGEPPPADLIDHVATGGEVHAWNLPFEFDIWNAICCRAWRAPPIMLAQAHCTMARAAQVGLPMRLELAALAAGTKDQKDKAGHALMMRMARPRDIRPDGTCTWWHIDEPARLERLVAYNAQDVIAERSIFAVTPDMSKIERETWLCDREMNLRGVRIDLDFVARLQELRGEEMIRLDEVIDGTTGGAVRSTNSTAKLLAWLKTQKPFDAILPTSLDKDNLPKLIAQAAKGSPARIALKARQQASKTSVAKLDAAEQGCAADGRIRHMFQYFGAVRTGRWAGRAMQLQNLPRPPKGLDVKAMAMEVATGVSAVALRQAGYNPLDVISALIRACIVADPGGRLVVADFSQIEARVVAWLAGHTEALRVFASGQDIYVYTAKGIGSDNRQLGKVLVLACGYQMGGGKFRETAATYGIFLTDAQASELVYAWRRANQPIADLWEATNAAAVAVVSGMLTAWQSVAGGKLAFRMNGPHLEMRLPSHRVITYRHAKLEMDKKFGRFGVVYKAANGEWGSDNIRTYGGKLIENATQAIARDLLRDVMLHLRHMGVALLATIHDELIAEAPDAEADGLLTDMLGLMRRAPRWAPGLPLDAAGFTTTVYGKG